MKTAKNEEKCVVIIPAEQVRAESASEERILKVAAYCRVSTDEEKQLESFENQVEYFTNMINANSKYELVKVYSDEGISGCRTSSRKGFCRMMDDCESGLIDFIITKSISRFARNTQDSLNYTRRLKDMGIGVFFEKEGINTLESSGELLLTLFSCFAQEESRSISENTTWGIRSKFRQGIPHLNTEMLLGYDRDEDGGLVINEEQAVTVRRIFSMYLEGFTHSGIASILNKENVPGTHGEARWCANTISRMLGNEKYKGAPLMQKTFTANYLTRQNVQNTGQLPQYYIDDNHQPIVLPSDWEAVQQETERRRIFISEHGVRGIGGIGIPGDTDSGSRSAFHSKLFCRVCRCKLHRKFGRGVSRAYWKCKECGRSIEDELLRDEFCKSFNRLVHNRDKLLGRWNEMISGASALESIRARQMIEITALGTIPYEIPELTQAVIQEAWLEPDGRTEFCYLSGD